MSILIVGAGATGGYFGGRLAQAGRDVTFLVTQRRAEVLSQRGLRIVGPGGTETITPRLTTPDSLSAVADTVFIAVKASALESVIKEIGPAVGPDTTIVPILNGIRHMGALNQAFGSRRVLGGVAVLATQLDGDGDVRQLNDDVSLVIGTQDRQRTAGAERTASELSGAGFPVAISDDILAAMWDKWAFIAAGGALNCLLRGAVAEIVDVGGADLARAIIEETNSIARAAGYPIPDDQARHTTQVLTAAGSPFTSSMYRDLQQGRPVEVETVLGDLLAEGRKAHLRTPLLEAATVALRVYAARLPGS
jgi:2-dehydropantoate 2-reductase